MTTDKLMILIAAREKLAQGWCQRAQAREYDGESANPLDTSAVQHCIVGGVMFAAGINHIPAAPKRFVDGGVIVGHIDRTPAQQLAMSAVDVIAAAIPDNTPYGLDPDPVCRVVHWNDIESRTHVEVLDVLDRAITSLMKARVPAEQELEVVE